MRAKTAYKCLLKVYTRSIVLGVWPIQIWQEVNHSNVCRAILMFWLTLGRFFSLFLGTFTVGFEYSWFIVNVIKFYFMAYLCETSNRRSNPCSNPLMRFNIGIFYILFYFIADLSKFSEHFKVLVFTIQTIF